MRTKEFIKRVEELGFKYYEDSEDIEIQEKIKGYTVSVINKRQMYSLSSGNSLYVEHPEKYITKELFDLISEYVKTPIEEREEEKKFYLRYKWINADYNYLNYNYRLDVYGLDRILSFNWIKGKFTLEEIDEIKEKYDTKLEDFEIVEVEE